MTEPEEDLAALEDAFCAGLPVEGRVERFLKGGYEVRICGQSGKDLVVSPSTT